LASLRFSFCERQPLNPNDPNYQEVIVIAQWQADILDIVSNPEQPLCK